MKRLIFILLSLPLTAALAWWDGVEPSTGTKVEIISKRNKIRKNGVIEIFDHGNNAYHEVEIYRISSHDRDVKFEVYDIDTGQDRTFIMESLSK